MAVASCTTGLTVQRFGEITILLENWLFESFGKQVYMEQLSRASDDLRMSKPELERFYQRVVGKPSNMKVSRFQDIALSLQQWRFKNAGTALYFEWLQLVRDEKGVDDAEIRYYARIATSR